MQKNIQKIINIGILLPFIALPGCATVQYKTLEKVGIYKRDILVDRIEDARDAQNEAKEQFVSAYERFRQLVETEDSDIEAKYKKLNKDVERSEERAAEIDRRLEDVEDVAEDLFDEWENELDQYSNKSLRDSSRKNLNTTRQRYEQMMARMRQARSKIDPVLYVLQDQTLFLKHNLNAGAVSALQNEITSVKTKVGALVEEMEAAIDEAERFIHNMESARG